MLKSNGSTDTKKYDLYSRKRTKHPIILPLGDFYTVGLTSEKDGQLELVEGKCLI